MALKEYDYNGAIYQFDEKSAPEGAVEVEPEPQKKQAEKPANKARTPRNKADKDD